MQRNGGYNPTVTRHPNRRGFLGSMLAASALRSAQIPIIDTHIHLYDPTRSQGVPWPPKSDPVLYKPTLPSRFVEMVRPLGVTGAVVVEASALVDDNQWILELAKDNPVIAGFVGHLEPGTKEFAGHLARFGANPLFRGIRLNDAALIAGVRQAAFVDDLRLLEERGLMIDAIGNFPMVAALAELSDRLPRLRIAIDHMSDLPAGWRKDANTRAVVRDLAKRPQVYSKVSGVVKQVNSKPLESPAAYRETLDELWELFGDDHVMYGSNWPVSDRFAPYQVVFNIVHAYVSAKGPSASAKYFAGNAKACYGWLERS